MSANKMLEMEIRAAYIFLREKSHTIPSDTLQFMLDASLEKLNSVEYNEVLDPVIKRSFMVSYLGTDDQGQIVKGIEVVAENESRAIEKVLEINCAKEIYGAIEVIA